MYKPACYDRSTMYSVEFVNHHPYTYDTYTIIPRKNIEQYKFCKLELNTNCNFFFIRMRYVGFTMLYIQTGKVRVVLIKKIDIQKRFH